MIRRHLIAVVLSAVCLALGATAVAQEDANEGEISRTTNDVTNEVMSPFCPGKTLAMCPSPAAAEVRRDIQQMARDGMKKEEIKTELIQKYGDEFELVEPDGFDNALILGLIFAGLLLCVGVVLFITRRRAPGEGSSDDGDDSDGPGGQDKPASPGKDDSEGGDPYLSALRDEYRS